MACAWERCGVRGRRSLSEPVRRSALVVAAALVLAGASAPATPGTPVTQPVADAVRPAVPNPDIDESCGLDATLILDASGSIESANAVDEVRDAAQAFLDALADTNSTARVIDFGSVARQTAPRTNVTTATVSPAGVLGQAVAAYYNPIPPIPSGVTAHQYRGGGRNINDPNSYTTTTSTIYTNWDDSLHRATQSGQELVLFVTDGQPNGVVDDHPGDPFYRAGDPTPDVRVSLQGNQSADDLSLDRGVEEANAIKTAGGRILAVGVGDAFGSNANIDRLKAVTNGAASNVVTDAGSIDSINDVDVAVVTDFDALADALRAVVTELCSPSLTIQKLAQSPGSAAYEPVAGWTMTVTPSVTAGGTPPYRWILPTPNAPVGPISANTNANGFAQFQWEPNPPTRSSVATVTETNKTDYTPRDWSCKAKNPDGTVVSTSGTFGQGAPTFTVDVGPQQIVTCTVRNDFNYAPAGIVTKVNNPVIVRGDGNGTLVTSHYTVENTGNTPVAPVSGTDTECTPVVYVRTAGGAISGDTNDDEILDPGETWDLQCVRRIQHATTTDEVVIPNTVTLVGQAPNGDVVSGQATDEIQVLTPDISIVKTANPTSGLAPLDVTYTYEVTTTGNAPIGDVTLSDDTAPCSTAANITFQGGDTANTGYLDPGETWTYTCDADGLTQGVVNSATVSGQPVTPVDPAVDADALDPIGGRVDATDDAEVTVQSADLAIDKSVSPLIGLTNTTFTYTIVVTNPAAETATLVPVTTRDAVIDDTQCSPATYQSGDTNDDSRMEPGESWTYTCARSYAAPGIHHNEATATMAVEGDGTELTATDPANVLVLAPAINLEKRVDKGVVYDGDTVTYTYEATNPGFVPLEDVTVTDDAGPGTCSPVTFVGGDTDGNNALNRGELWEYTCTTTLVKTGSATAPQVVDNTATVEGTPVIGSETDAPITDDATARVIVIDPQISLSKVADPTEVRLPDGAQVTWTVSITNTGDTALYNVLVTDDTCSPMVYQSGDAGDNGIMDVGEVWFYECFADVNTDTTNTASVTANDVLGGDVTDSDPADVTTFSSSIELVKTVDDTLVLSGTTVNYGYTATNTGTDQLHDVELTDDKCSPLSGPTGDTGSDGLMDAGEAWSWTCQAAITTTTTNTATVTGLDHTDTEVSDVDFATVVPFVTGIHIEKSATPTILYGPGVVTYTYDVTNTGNVPLSNVKDRVTDDKCASVTYVAGDGDGNELLTSANDIFETGPMETWRFICRTTISVTTLNTATTIGTPEAPPFGEQQGVVPAVVIAEDVTDTDTALVRVLPPPSITIVKRLASPGNDTFAFGGDLGKFSIKTSGGRGSQAFTGLQPGTYQVVERSADGWLLASIDCNDPGGNSSGRGTTATIHLNGSEHVTCIFTNVALPATNTLEQIARALPPPLRNPVGYALVVWVVTGAVTAGFAMLYLGLRSRRRRLAAAAVATSEAAEVPADGPPEA